MWLVDNGKEQVLWLSEVWDACAIAERVSVCVCVRVCYAVRGRI